MSTYEHHESWLVPFLSVVRTRPGMYLGDERVRTLDTYLRGYVQAREDLGVPAYGHDESNLMQDFEEWLSKRLKSNAVCPWSARVEEEDNSDRNVYTFFRLFEEFLAERGRSLLEFKAARSRWPAHPWPIKGWPPMRD